MPEVTLDDYEGDARNECAEEMERDVEAMRREYEMRTGVRRDEAEATPSGAEGGAHSPARWP